MFRVLEQVDQLKLIKARALFLNSNTQKFKEYANFYAIYVWAFSLGVNVASCNLAWLFTALHVMQTRYCEENSVRPSVCLSVCPSVTRVNCDKTVESSVQIYVPYERTFSLVFSEEEWLVGGDPLYLKFWVNRPPLERNRRFSTNNCYALSNEPKMIVVRCP